MPAPNTITLTCPLCSQQVTASKTQGLSAMRAPGGQPTVTISLNYDSTPHECPAFPADVSTASTTQKKTTKKARTTRKTSPKRKASGGRSGR